MNLIVKTSAATSLTRKHRNSYTWHRIYLFLLIYSDNQRKKIFFFSFSCYMNVIRTNEGTVFYSFIFRKKFIIELLSLTTYCSIPLYLQNTQSVWNRNSSSLLLSQFFVNISHNVITIEPYFNDFFHLTKSINLYPSKAIVCLTLSLP